MIHRSVLTVCILAAAVVWTACPGSSYNSPTQGSPATVHAFIHETGGNDVPIPGVMVTIDGRTATTDAQGNCVITGLTSGTAQVSLSKAGYQSSSFAHTLYAGDNTLSVGLERS